MQPTNSKRMLNNLSSLGHLGNLKKDDILSVGVNNEIFASIEHLAQSGAFRIITRNFEGIYQAFSQLKLPCLTLDDVAPLSILGSISPPTPHLGIIKKNAKEPSRVWIKS